MASKKHKSAKGGGETVLDDTPQHLIEPSDEATALTAEAITDTRWIMREAAWGRMFGRIEAKNRFAR